jgi:hypothetical protein
MMPKRVCRRASLLPQTFYTRRRATTVGREIFQFFRCIMNISRLFVSIKLISIKNSVPMCSLPTGEKNVVCEENLKVRTGRRTRKDYLLARFPQLLYYLSPWTYLLNSLSNCHPIVRENKETPPVSIIATSLLWLLSGIPTPLYNFDVVVLGYSDL